MLLEVADQLPRNTLVLRERAAAIYDTIVTQARHYVDAASDTETPRSLLAMSLNNLAGFLSDLGQRKEALATVQKAVRLYRQLAEAQPETFLPDLAGSLNNLANRLSDLGQWEAALTAAQEAVIILSPFFLALPSAFAHWMPMMVRNYRNYAEQLQREPDARLLAPIIEKLNALQSSTGGES